MQVDDVPNVAPNVAPNFIAPNIAAPNVTSNVMSDIAPNIAPNIVVPNIAPNVVALNSAPNVVVPNIVTPNVVPNDVLNAAPNPPPAAWPVETELIFVPGTTRVMLTTQRPLMRSVIHDAFERVRVQLLFNNAFPDAAFILSMTKDALVTAAESRERSSSIHQRLLNDEEYLTSMIRLVSHYTCM